ncbi:MAG: hypothetical protein HXX17_08245 [Geobacteraceae bacterium]|nr:hypothetical protein [Geobacteraceae bacterium]
MKSLDLFLPRLLPWVIGCPDPLIRQALVDAAIEFCELTGVIQTISAPQTAVTNLGTYTITLPAYTDAVSTKTVWYGVDTLTPVQTEALENVYAYVSSVGTHTQTAGLPKEFYEASPGVIGIYPIPDATNIDYITAKVVTKPMRDAPVLDDALYTDWVDALVVGARKRLHAIPDQSFSSDVKAAEASREFQRYATKAANLAMHGRVQGSLRVQTNFFA